MQNYSYDIYIYGYKSDDTVSNPEYDGIVDAKLDEFNNRQPIDPNFFTFIKTISIGNLSNDGVDRTGCTTLNTWIIKKSLYIEERNRRIQRYSGRNDVYIQPEYSSNLSERICFTYDSLLNEGRIYFPDNQDTDGYQDELSDILYLELHKWVEPHAGANGKILLYSSLHENNTWGLLNPSRQNRSRRNSSNVSRILDFSFNNKSKSRKSKGRKSHMKRSMTQRKSTARKRSVRKHTKKSRRKSRVRKRSVRKRSKSRARKHSKKSRRKRSKKSRKKSRKNSARKHSKKSRRTRKFKMMSGLQALMRSMGQGDVFNTPDYFPYEDNYEKNTSKGWKSIINKIKEQQKIAKELTVAEQAIKKRNYTSLLKESEKYTNKKLEKLHKKADKLIRERKFAKADEIYVDILKHRLDIHAMFMLGHLRMEEARDFTYALDVFNNILKLDPGNPRALFYTSWLLYILNDSRELANQRIKDLLRQGPQKNLLILLDFIKTRNILDAFVAIDYLHNVYNLLPKDLVRCKERRKMENGIKQHIELLKTQTSGQLDEYEDELPYSENIKVYDDDDDDDDDDDLF